MPIEELDKKGFEHDNGWVVGNLIQNGNEPWIVGDLVEVDDEYIVHDFWVKVHPESVGQFTGLEDKNGKDIYEGDEFHLGDPKITYTVVWHDTGLMGKQNGSSSFVGLNHWKDRIEIVGNIYESNHDN